MRGLRQVRCFRECKIIIIPEDNLASEAQEIAEDLLETEEGVTVLCGRAGRYGVRTGANRSQYVSAAGKRFAENAVSYHKTLVTANPFASANLTPAERVTAARAEFERQLRSFRKIAIMPKSLLSAIRMAHSGRADKDNHRSSRMRDDLCLAFILGVFWSGHHIIGTAEDRGHGNRLVRPRAPGDELVHAPVGAIGGAFAFGTAPAVLNPAGEVRIEEPTGGEKRRSDGTLIVDQGGGKRRKRW